MDLPENPRHSDDGTLGPIVIELDESQLTVGTLSPEQKLATWQWDRVYMEKLKKYHPEEYEKIMKERAARGIKPPPELGQ